MVSVIWFEQYSTSGSYPDGLMANFHPKNIYFALNIGGLEK
jgi:hypothetical protein